MLRPIPSVMLKDTAIFHVPVSMDKYQEPIYEDIEVKNVHIQPTNATKKNISNEEVVLRAMLFIDGRKSTPNIDYLALQLAAEAVGANITVDVIGCTGESKTYTVETVDALPDVPATRVHHTEIGLV